MFTYFRVLICTEHCCERQVASLVYCADVAEGATVLGACVLCKRSTVVSYTVYYVVLLTQVAYEQR